MINASSPGASDFYWDFGDGSPGAAGYEPSHVFPSIGDYTLTLIAQYGTVCADTATRLLKIGTVNADMDDLDPTCISNAASFTDISTDRKSTRLNSSHVRISYAVFCLKKKKKKNKKYKIKKKKKNNI